MVALYIAAGILCAVTAALSVRFFQQLVDAIAEGEPVGAALLLYGAAALAEYLINYLDNYPYTKLRHSIYQKIKQLALQKIATIDFRAYQQFGTGLLVQRIENGATAGRDILFEFYLRIAAELLPGAATSIALIGAFNLTVMLAALAGYALVYLITKLLLKRLYSVKEKTLVSEEWLSKRYVRAFMELGVFRVNRRFGREIDRIAARADEVAGAHTRIKMVHELFFTAFALIMLAFKLILIVGGVAAITRGEMSIGMLLALMTLIERVYQPVAVFNVIFVDYRLNRIAWDRFTELTGAPDDLGLRGGEAFEARGGGIRFEKIHFTYKGAQVLRGVDLAIPEGRLVALAGKSGGGKSTLVKLAMGLLKPTSGRLLVSGQDLSRLDLNSFYPHVAYVAQDTPVFDGTLRENICFDRDADDAALLGLLERARLSELAASHEDGLDMNVGERGVKLSGGERQRLAIARVLFQKPKFVILDEPTSALDPDTENHVMGAIRALLPETTILFVAHRPETLRYADRIVLLEDGCVRGIEDSEQ